MIQPVEEVSIPTDCSLHESAQNAYFADAFATLIPRSDLTATQLYAAVMRSTPAWVDSLMRARNGVVAWFGLKNLGVLSAVPDTIGQPLQIGQLVGIFSFVRETPTELVIQDTDKHLTVQIAVIKQTVDSQHDRLIACTVVHIHNLLGRAYLVPVGKTHKYILPAVLRGAPTAVLQTIQLHLNNSLKVAG